MRFLLSSILFLGVVFSGQSQTDKSVALNDLLVDVVYLSSDYLQGREAGTESETLAAEYIAGRFKEIGLAPKGSDGYFQHFEFSYKSHPHATTGEKRKAKNVIGFIDNKAPNTVVVCAHYDHLGMGGSGSLHAGDPAIHNGADDNASGVAALLRIATELNHSKKRNRKNNYLFLAVSGEEHGLLGSKYFVENPTVPIVSISYMLNMDMVGRLNEKKTLIINGVGTSPRWKNALKKIKVGGIKISTTESGVGPSDHTSFYWKDIPVLHFFTGSHEQYHKPTDDAHLINFPGLRDVSNYLIALIKDVNPKKKLQFTKTKDEGNSGKASAFKVSLGVIPDYAFDGKGMRIDGVLDDRPAQKAGLEKGDIVVKIGDTDVTDIYKYMEGLGKLKKGDSAIVVVKRGEEVLEKDVVF